MKAIRKFLSELESINGNMERYHQKADYWPFLADLRNKATTEAALLSEAKKQRLLSRCDLIGERFEKFWPAYHEQHKTAREKTFLLDEFEIKIYWLFIGQPVKPTSKNQRELLQWLTYWKDAIMIKQAELLHLTRSIKPQAAKDEKPQISIPVLALKYYYLEVSRSVYQTKEAFLAENGRSESIKNFRNTCYAISRETEKDPLKEAYLKKVIPLLENYPRAKQLAENALYSFIEGVRKGK
jgi:hypothetical protein